jgi:hypothetical protein
MEIYVLKTGDKGMKTEPVNSALFELEFSGDL